MVYYLSERQKKYKGDVVKINTTERKHIIRNFANYIRRSMNDLYGIYPHDDLLIESATGYYMFKGYHGKIAQKKALKLLNIKE